MSLKRFNTFSQSSPLASGPVIKEGWLCKEGGAARTKWQNRWFKLHGKTLHYYTKKEDSSPNGSINLDEVKDVSRIGEHSGKQFCFTLVGAKGGGKPKVYYLAAESEELMNEWFVGLQVNMSPDVPVKLVKYATVEVFLTQGVRITGDVHYNILSIISHRVNTEKKKRDSLGWFCDRPIALAVVLNLFAEYGWTPERIYRSTALAANDSAIHPVVRVIFSKSPGESQGPVRKDDRPLISSGRFSDSVHVSAQPVAPPSPAPGRRLLDGANSELIALMQEFDIPLTLLELPSDRKSVV